LAHQQQAEQHAERRQHDRCKNETNRRKPVELREQDRKIRKIAVPNAFMRKAPAFARSSSSPLSRNVTPGPRSALASSRAIACWTFADCTPSATFAATVITRLAFTRLM